MTDDSTALRAVAPCGGPGRGERCPHGRWILAGLVERCGACCDRRPAHDHDSEQEHKNG